MNRPPEGPLRRSARAKVNVRLRILGREDSGYHALETLFLRLELADDVEVAVGGEGIHLSVGGPAAEAVPTDGANLCWRAAQLFAAAAGLAPAVALRLEKRIPVGAGLGGGSADAAATLTALNELHGAPLPGSAVWELAGELGSDVPFALLDVPFALGWERGRRLLPLPPPPSRPALLLIPERGVATAEAYAWLDSGREPSGERAYALPPPGELASWETLAALAWNDFEEPVFRRLPELGAGKAALVAAGARLALLSGSGSALFAVFDDEERREAALRSLSLPYGFRLVATRTLGPAAPDGRRGPTPGPARRPG